jgi:hypothetical protein
MNKRQLTIACIFLFVSLAVSAVVAQEQAGSGSADQTASSGAVQPNEADPTARETAPVAQTADRGSVSQELKSPSAPAAPKATAVKTARKDQPAKEAVNPQAGTGLLDVNDEEYKLVRIPGMPAVKKADDSLKAEAEDAAVEESAGADVDKEKDGFLGMSKETESTVMIVVFFLLIAAIFILYRVRSKGGRRRVTRSYLKR